jgi:hypothetical protein
MTGKVKYFVTKLREVNPEIRLDHCLFLREAFVADILSGVLKNVLDKV